AHKIITIFRNVNQEFIHQLLIAIPNPPYCLH
ncbi:hypothetical protein A2U01_0087258, partial [Trifolium medium]|nr:hypothetical protein [Trifolium medium]